MSSEIPEGEQKKWGFQMDWFVFPSELMQISNEPVSTCTYVWKKWVSY